MDVLVSGLRARVSILPLGDGAAQFWSVADVGSNFSGYSLIFNKVKIELIVIGFQHRPKP